MLSCEMTADWHPAPLGQDTQSPTWHQKYCKTDGQFIVSYYFSLYNSIFLCARTGEQLQLSLVGVDAHEEPIVVGLGAGLHAQDF